MGWGTVAGDYVKELPDWKCFCDGKRSYQDLYFLLPPHFLMFHFLFDFFSPLQKDLLLLKWENDSLVTETSLFWAINRSQVYSEEIFLNI